MGLNLNDGGHLTHGARSIAPARSTRACPTSLTRRPKCWTTTPSRQLALEPGRKSSSPATPPTRASSTGGASAPSPTRSGHTCWPTSPTSPAWWPRGPPQPHRHRRCRVDHDPQEPLRPAWGDAHDPQARHRPQARSRRLPRRAGRAAPEHHGRPGRGPEAGAYGAVPRPAAAHRRQRRRAGPGAKSRGIRIVGGGSQNHLLLIDTKSVSRDGVHLSGDMASRILDVAGHRRQPQHHPRRRGRARPPACGWARCGSASLASARPRWIGWPRPLP
jgi:hypothetical protein